jgi:sigma-B regulation protein RsbU (phosphoserine phosphatase)
MPPPRHLPLILVVDDDVTTNRMIQGILARAGFRTACAFDVAGALAGLREQQPDLVLLDVGLPDGSGYDVCRTLHAGTGAGHTPVLFISANDDIAAKVQGFESGGVDYITKPLAGAEIIARVSTHLRLKQAYERIAELQAEQIQRLAGAQEALMPAPQDYPEAGFHTALDQVLKAGGDFYDVIPVGDQMFDYVVADASGHDLSVSFWTAALKTLVGEYASPASAPRDIVHAINNSLCRILPEGMYFTLIYGRLNRRVNRLTLVSAGHPPALVLERQKSVLTAISQEGDVAGAFADATFAVTEIGVRRGDRFFLYSDGLIELNGPREAGIRQLSDACLRFRDEPLAQSLQSIRRTVLDGAVAQDDTLLLGVDV